MSTTFRKVLFVLLTGGTVFLIVCGSSYLIEKKLKKIEDVLPETLKFKLPNQFQEIENFTNLENINKILESFREKEGVTKKEFITPDKKLKIEYTSEWIEISPEKAKVFFSEEILKKYNAKILFFAEKFSLGKIAILCIQEILMKQDVGIDEIIEEMRKNNQEQGRTMEILEMEKKDNEAIFEGRYKNKYETHTKERVFLLEPENSHRKIFLIVYMTLEKDWKGLQNEAAKIINSARLIK